MTCLCSAKKDFIQDVLPGLVQTTKKFKSVFIWMCIKSHHNTTSLGELVVGVCSRAVKLTLI